MNTDIFKAYDIRGVYPEDFGGETGVRVARALVRLTGARRVMLGYDARVSSPALVAEVLEGLMLEGVTVVDVGLVTTPMFNFAVASDAKADAGIMVTASHNPAKYNGFKLARAGAVPIGAGSGMETLREMAEAPQPNPAKKRGKVTKREILKKYLDKIFKLANVPTLSALRSPLIIDNGNGMVGVPLPAFLKKAKLKAKVLYGEVDCSFPNHEANPIKDETLVELKREVVASKALCGIAFDGDGDRVGFTDEKGERVPGDIIGAFIAEDLLEVNPDALIFGDVRSGRAFAETVKENGGKFALVPVGHANIKRLMRESGALFGAELSCHYYYRDLWNFESSLLTVLLVLKRLAHEKKPLSELLAPLRKYFVSGEINSTVDHPMLVLKHILDRFLPEAQFVNTEDGVRLDFSDWWFSLRASNTEPLIRLNVEASSREVMEQKRDELLELIRVKLVV